jgi:hypothetical protein
MLGILNPVGGIANDFAQTVNLWADEFRVFDLRAAGHAATVCLNVTDVANDGHR